MKFLNYLYEGQFGQSSPFFQPADFKYISIQQLGNNSVDQLDLRVSLNYSFFIAMLFLVLFSRS